METISLPSTRSGSSREAWNRSPTPVLRGIDCIDGSHGNTRSCRDGDIRQSLHACMVCRLRFAGKRTRRRLRLVTCCPFGIKFERNDVSEVVPLHRGADLVADLTLRATHELALNQAAILQFQRIGQRKRRRQPQGNDQSAIQLPVEFSSAAFLFPSPGSSRLGLLGILRPYALGFTWTSFRSPFRGARRTAPIGMTFSK